MYAANTRKMFYDKWKAEKENRFRTFTAAENSDELPRLEQAHKSTTWYPLERRLYCPGNYLFFRFLTREKLILKTSESTFNGE